MSKEPQSELLRIMEKYPEVGKSVYNVSINNNISFDYILNYPHPVWDEWERNPNVPLEYIKSKEFQAFGHWRGNLILCNPSLTLDYIRLHHSHWSFDWKHISCNPSLTIDWLLEFPDKDWDWFVVSANPNITPEHILSNSQFKWDWSGVSRNPSVTMEFIENNPDLPWDAYYIGLNPNIDMIYLNNMLNKNTNTGISANQYGILTSSMITIESLISEFDKGSLMGRVLPSSDYLKGISGNPNLTLNHIKQFESLRPDIFDKMIDWSWLSRNPSLKREWIDAYPDKPWEWGYISANEFEPYYPKKKIEQSMIDEIHLSRYRPKGPGYHEAKESFDNAMLTVA